MLRKIDQNLSETKEFLKLVEKGEISGVGSRMNNEEVESRRDDLPADEMLDKVDRLNEEIRQLLQKYSSASPLENEKDDVSAQKEKKEFIGRPYVLEETEKREFGLEELEKRLKDISKDTYFKKDDSIEYENLDGIYGEASHLKGILDLSCEKSQDEQSPRFGENSEIKKETDSRMDFSHQGTGGFLDYGKPSQKDSKQTGIEDRLDEYEQSKKNVMNKYFPSPSPHSNHPPMSSPHTIYKDVSGHNNYHTDNILEQLKIEENKYSIDDSLYLEKMKGLIDLTKKELDLIDSNRPSTHTIHIQTSAKGSKVGLNSTHNTNYTKNLPNHAILEPSRLPLQDNKTPISLLTSMKEKNKGPVSINVSNSNRDKSYGVSSYLKHLPKPTSSKYESNVPSSHHYDQEEEDEEEGFCLKSMLNK